MSYKDSEYYQSVTKPNSIEKKNQQWAKDKPKKKPSKSISESVSSLFKATKK